MPWQSGVIWNQEVCDSLSDKLIKGLSVLSQDSEDDLVISIEVFGGVEEVVLEGEGLFQDTCPCVPAIKENLFLDKI